MKKKTAKKSIISLALCAFACCIAGGVSFLRGGDVKAAAATAPVYNTLEAFTIEEEGSIRTSDYNGIRFRTVLEQEELDAIDALGLSNMQYGTLILPADYLGSQELTHATVNVLDIQTKKWQQEGTEWTSVLAGAKDANGEYTSLPESYNNRPLAARSYVTGIKDGVTVYYYTENTVVRSIGYVAHMEEQTQESVTDQVANISKDADIRVEFVNENQISANQSEPANGAVELISNKLPNSTEKMAVLTIGGVPYENAKVSYEYTTSNADVISVNGTTVVANKVGKATITVTATYVLDEENETTITRTATREINTDTFVGASDYKILISENAKTASAITYANFANGGIATSAQYEKAAAELLQKIFAEATGVELPIVTSVNDGDKFISIGATGKETGKTVSTTKDTSAQVFVDGGNVYILGNIAPEAVYYGTHQFLTDTVGYEFLMENTYSYDGNTEVQAAAKAYEPDIEYNVIQSDLRVDGVMDGYSMQDYTRDMIALGINKENQKSAFHQGIAHNSVLVVNNDLTIDNDHTIYTNWTGTKTDTVSDEIYQFEDSEYKDWYATYTKTGDGVTKYTKKTVGSLIYYTTTSNSSEVYYHMIANPYYGSTSQPDPFATYTTDDKGNEVCTSPARIRAELCYTAHGNTTARTALIKVVADEMIAQLKANPTRTRLGFSHMDHRIWCTCSSCTTQGNPSDNLLEFLLDVAAAVKSRWSETGRTDSSDNFKISSLFYHATNLAPVKTGNYADKLSSYGKHVEVWFAESAADYLVPFDYTSETAPSLWNPSVHENLKVFKDLGMDILWWGYYGTTIQFYVPYDSLNAIRGNYALAKEYGIDFMFNQMMSSTQNFARLKEYLMSKLAWNADVEDNEWNGWIESYFKGAYGDGWEKMYKYFVKDSEDTTFTSWGDWCSNNWNNLKTNSGYNATATSVDGSIGKTEVLTSSYFSTNLLESWINTIDQAINALDPNDPNYDTYYWNIKREKATPLYLMMYIFGDNRIESGEGLSTWDAPTDYTDTEFEGDTSYVLKYGAEFLEIIAHCDLAYFGEGRSIDIFKTAIENVLSNATTTTVKDDQIVDAGSSLTLKHTAITAGDYTVRVIGEDGVQTATATASAGSITIPATIAAGKTYIVELLSSAGNVIRFTNVHTRTENANHQVMAKTQYMFCDEQDLLLKDSAIKAGTTYTVKIDARQYTATSYVNGKLSVPIGQMAVNTNKKVLCDDGATTYEFNVICANPIRTAEDLKELGMGNNNNTALKDITGYYVLANDITFVHQDDWSDLIAAGYDAASDGVKDDKGNYINKYHFKGVFDGNGYTIDNMRVSDGGIFGTATEATIKNVNLTNVHLIEDIPTGLSEQNGGYIAIFAYTAPKSTFENINITMATSPNNKWTWKRDGLFVCSGSSGAATFRNITVDASGLMLKTLLGISHNEANVYENVVIKAADYVAVGYTGDSYIEYRDLNEDGQIGSGDGEQNTAVLMPKGTYPDGVTFEEVGLCITTEETEVRANGSLTVKTNQEGVTYDLETKITGVSIGETTGELTVSNRVEIGTKITVIATSADGSAKKTFTVIRALETYTAATQNVEMGHYLDGTTVVMPTSATIDLSEIYDTYLAGSNVTVTCGDTTWYQGVFGSNSWTITLDESMKSWSGIKNLVFTSETNTCEYEITLPVNFVQGVIELDKDNVGSPTDLQAIMMSHMGGHYVLTSDLDMNNVELKGWGTTPFTGVLDGNGYGIVNTQLNISGQNGEGDWVPVLIVRNEGTVKNIRFEINGYNYTAGSSGRGLIATNNGTVSNVYMTLNLNYQSPPFVRENDNDTRHTWTPSRGNETTWTGGLVRDNYGAIENAIVKVTKNDGITINSEFIGALAYKNYASGTVTGYMISDIDTIEAVQLNEGTATVNRYSAWNEELIKKISSWTAPWDNLAYGVCFGKSMIYEDPNVSATNINKTVTMSIKDGVVTLPDGIGSTIKSVTFNGTEIFVSADGNAMTFDGSAISTADLGANKTLIVRTSENKYQLQAIAATDIITTADELRGLGAGKASSQVAITGYYVLGNDIDCTNAEVFAAGNGIGGDAYFKGVFDGNNYTIKNIKVNTGGIFGNTNGATIKNVNFTGVIYDAVSYADTYGAWGNYTALLACNAAYTTFEKIDVQVAETKFSFNNANEHFYEAVLFVIANGTVSVKDVTVDATGLALENVLGLYIDTENVTVNFENVLVKAASYSTIGYAAGVNADLANTDDEVKEWPTGVTFECVSSVTKNGDQTALDLPVYEGDVTELGFAAGTKVLTQYIANSSTAWSARTLTTTNSQFDYVDIQFSLSKSIGSLCVWMPGIDGNWTATLSGAIVGGKAPEHKIFILEADGSATSDTALAANKVYTLRVYLGIGEKGVSVSAFYSETESVTIYYNSVATFGNEVKIPVEELDETVTIETYNNTTVTLPETISGNVVAVTVGGVEIFNSAISYGSVSGNVITMGDDLSKSQSNLGEDKEMLVTMEDGTIYKLTANVYTMIINSAEELDQWQAVSAQTAVDQGISTAEQKGYVYSGYFALGNNIEYNNIWTPYKTFGQIWGLYGNKDFSALTVAKENTTANAKLYTDGSINEDWGVGYFAGFKGIFDGNGYYINGLQTSGDYAAFVVTMGGGTIKDVAFTNAKVGAGASLVYDRGNGYLENVYVQVVSMTSGASDKATALVNRSTNKYNPSSMTGILVDVSAIDYANLTWVQVASLVYAKNNIYVIGMPEGITQSSASATEDPLVFLHYNPNTGNATDYDAAGDYVNVAALLADETHGAVVKDWSEHFWTVTESNVLPNVLTQSRPMDIGSVVQINNYGTVSMYTADSSNAYFAEGTAITRYTGTATAGAWNSRMKILTNPSKEAVKFDFVLSQACNYMIVWRGMADSTATTDRSADIGSNAVYVLPGDSTNPMKVAILDINGYPATSLAANTLYTMVLYHYGESALQIGFNDANMVVDIANIANISVPQNINLPVSALKGTVIDVYEGDVTELGFDAGTYVFDYATPDVSYFGESASGWTKCDNMKLNIVADENGTASFQFVLTKAFSSSDAFAVWPPSGFCGQINSKGVVSPSSDAYANFAVITDEEGNVVNGTALETHKVYTLTISVAGITEFRVGTLEPSEFHIYVANVNAHVNA